jgi:hypothetical protein
MEKKALWIVMALLLAANIALLLDRRSTASSFAQMRREAAVSHQESQYNAEQETLLIATSEVSASLLRSTSSDPGVDLQFLLFASIDDCTNCIEDEIAKLNEISRASPSRATAVRGIYVDVDREPAAAAMIANLSPVPVFPISIENVMTDLPKATTPLVLVVRTTDGRILDAHKPIPENLSRRDAFYERWRAALDLD